MTTLGQPRKHFAQTDSTNRVALDWIDAPHGALVVADEQSAGRGRLGRSWESPAGAGLYCSLVLRLQTPVPALALMAGLGVARAIQEVSGLNIQCKWPNDVLCRGKKIGGILCEARDERVIVGIGLNLTHTREQLPERPIFPASSLLLESGRAFRSTDLLDPLLHALETVLADDNWRDDYEKRMWGRGEIARAGQTMGVVEGVAADGQLRLQTADGPRTVLSGEVEWI